MKASSISRREFLADAALLTATAVVLSPAALFAAEAKKKIPIGVQLYSVRKDCAKDLPGTLKAVGKIGCKAVEFAGYYGRDAKTLRQMLDDSGVKCCGTHIQLNTLLGDNLAKSIEFNQTLGNINLIVASLPSGDLKTKAAWEKTADQFSAVAEKLKPLGMRVGYHNHTITASSSPPSTARCRGIFSSIAPARTCASNTTWATPPRWAPMRAFT